MRTENDHVEPEWHSQGGGVFKLVHDSIKPPVFALTVSSPNLSESSLTGRAPVLGFSPYSPRKNKGNWRFLGNNS